MVARLTDLLREHERAGRGWAGASVDDVLVEVSERGLRMRENVVVRDPDGEIRAWGSVHDRAEGRMLFVHVVERDLPDDVADACSALLFSWAEGQARAVGAARGLDVQQIDTGAFADDDRQHAWLEPAGFERVRTWLQMSRPVASDEAALVPDPGRLGAQDVAIRRVRRRDDDGLPDSVDLHAVHQVLEQAFRDHFNSWEETFGEFVHRVREDPGHRWDHWWLAELAHEDLEGIGPMPVGALVGTHLESSNGRDGSYVSYIGVLDDARGRGVAKALLHTIIADAAVRGRDRVGLEVDADSPTGAARPLRVARLGDVVRHGVVAPRRARHLLSDPRSAVALPEQLLDDDQVQAAGDLEVRLVAVDDRDRDVGQVVVHHRAVVGGHEVRVVGGRGVRPAQDVGVEALRRLRPPQRRPRRHPGDRARRPDLEDGVGRRHRRRDRAVVGERGQAVGDDAGRQQRPGRVVEQHQAVGVTEVGQRREGAGGAGLPARQHG